MELVVVAAAMGLLPSRSRPHRASGRVARFTMDAIPARLWQADSPPEASKPRVGVKIVQTRVRGQINGQIIAPILVRPLQPGKPLIFFAEARVNDGEVVGRDIGA